MIIEVNYREYSGGEELKEAESIKKVINIDEATFDREKLKRYISSSNNDIDKLNIFKKLCFYNYKITNKKELDKMFNNCIEYIFKYINENIRGCYEIK